MIADVGRKPGYPANTDQEAKWERVLKLPQGRHPDGWYSLTPAQAQHIESETNGEGPGILYLDDDGGTCLKIPRAWRAPQVGDNSPWGIITKVADIAFQIAEVTTERYGGLWLGWDRVRALPPGYVPWTGYWSWAERINDAPMVLSFFLLDADHEKAARLGKMEPGTGISRNRVGTPYLPHWNWQALCRNGCMAKTKRAKDAATRFLARSPFLLATVAGCRVYEHPVHGDTATLMAITPAGALVDTGFYEVPTADELCDAVEAWRTAP